MALSKESPLGQFEVLPVEVLHHLFSSTSPDDLGNLANSSKEMGRVVEGWLFSSARSELISMSRFKMDQLDERKALDVKDKYARYGLLIRRITCVKGDAIQRLHYANSFLSQIPGAASLLHHHRETAALPLECLGTFLKVLMLGWSDFDCVRVFEHIQKASNLEKTVTRFLINSQGGSTGEELLVRLHYRCIFIDAAERRGRKLLWLHQIFKDKKMHHKVKLLYLLYGPTTVGGLIDWRLPLNFYPWNLMDGHQKFRDLGNILKFFEEETWGRKDLVVSMMVELLRFPRRWDDAAIAAVLHYSGPELEWRVLSRCYNEGFLDEPSTVLSMTVFISGFNCLRLINCLHSISETVSPEKYRQIIHVFFWMFHDACQNVHLFAMDSWADVVKEYHQLFIMMAKKLPL